MKVINVAESIRTSGFENKWCERDKVLSEEALRKKHGDIVIDN